MTRELVDHLFRHRAGQMVARLARTFGPENLDLVEDVVQEALLKALRVWSINGPPDEPEAWLVRVARNGALDALRRRSVSRDKLADIQRWVAPAPGADAGLDEEIRDDSLRLIFACCSPTLTSDARVALTLKLLGGFSVAELASAFLVSESTMAQRLVRAKAALREEATQLAIPEGVELEPRLDSVLEVLYLTFNEGYSAHGGEELVRSDLVREAMRLASLVATSPSLARPKVHALLALMHFQAARLPARQSADGIPLRLEEQDRSKWNRQLIRQGFAHFERAVRGDEFTRFHLEAGIASEHAAAPSFAETNWGSILAAYNRLARLTPSPVVSLNRAVAIAMVDGPRAALQELDRLELDPVLARYHLLPATRGEMHRRLGEHERAAESYRRALTLVSNAPQRRLLEQRLEESR